MDGADNFLVVIAGPTAVGKTALAIELARHYQTEIISADSRQFYRELNIGTAKPSEAQLQAVPHHCINTKSITELYGAGHFEKDVLALLDALFQKHRMVIMTGGSGLYIDSVLKGVDAFEEVPPHIRESLNNSFANRGIDYLREELKAKDPLYYSKVDLHNPQRIIRALEVMEHSGKPYSSFLQAQEHARHFTPVKILVNCPREVLYQRINERVDQMMKDGLLEEVKGLMPHKNHNALKTVGYKELFDYLAGVWDLNTAVEKIKQHTRNYAKRQLTWFRNRDQFEEFAPNDLEKLIAYLDTILSHGQSTFLYK